MKIMTNEWLKVAKDDLDLIKEILNRIHLTHLIAFHAEQCVEKSLKAVLEEFEQEIPKIHNLEKLLSLVKSYIDLDIDISIIEKLDKLYIDSRYPSDLGLLPDGKPSLIDASEFYEFAKMIYTKIYDFLSENRSDV